MARYSTDVAGLAPVAGATDVAVWANSSMGVRSPCMAVDTLGHLLALHVTPASVEDRGEVERLARTVQAVTNDAVELAWVD